MRHTAIIGLLIAAFALAAAPAGRIFVWIGQRVSWVVLGQGLVLDTTQSPPMLSVRIPGCTIEDNGLTCESLSTSGAGAGQMTMADGATPPAPPAGQHTLFFSVDGHLMMEDSAGTVTRIAGTVVSTRTVVYKPTVPTADFGIADQYSALRVYRNGSLQTEGIDYSVTASGVEFQPAVPGGGEVVALVYDRR